MVRVTEETSAKKLDEFDNHKLVIRFEDPTVGLKGFIAIHSDLRGPATGGTRMLPYLSETDALTDVLRLSRAMTYKCALAGVPFGGGKGVIIGDPYKNKNKALLSAYAKVVDSLDGEFTTGEDVGITGSDVEIMGDTSKAFLCTGEAVGKNGYFTALGVFYAMQEAAKNVFGSDSLKNKAVAVKGVGKVGSELVGLLHNVGAKITVADIRKPVLDQVVGKYSDVQIIDPEKILYQNVDILSPCAIGKDFTRENIEKIQAKIICGAANNQLENQEVGTIIFKRGILYAPDYVVNCGGLINVVDQQEPRGYKSERVVHRIANVKKRLAYILTFAERKKISSADAAEEVVRDIFEGKKSFIEIDTFS